MSREWDGGVLNRDSVGPLALESVTVQPSTMNLRNAAFLAFVGMLLLTVLVAADFVNAFVGFIRNLVPAMVVLRSLIYLFAAVCVTLYFYVSSRK
jgi:hypothetical protein